VQEEVSRPVEEAWRVEKDGSAAAMWKRVDRES